MIRLTKKLLFAIEAVLDIAYNGGQVPVRSSEITEREGIPRRYLEPVLQELVRQKILLGIRGPSALPAGSLIGSSAVSSSRTVRTISPRLIRRRSRARR